MTKQDPTNTRQAVAFMSKLSGIPISYEQVFPTLDSLCYSTTHKPPKRKVIYPAANIKVVTHSGEIVEYYSNNQRFNEKGIIAKEFIVTMYRKLTDFNVEYSSVGKYKNCEGNGWYCMVELYKIKDHEFYFI